MMHFKISIVCTVCGLAVGIVTNLKRYEEMIGLYWLIVVIMYIVTFVIKSLSILVNIRSRMV